MKLLYCPECEDVISLRAEIKTCHCGKCRGAYLSDGLRAWIQGPCLPLGFDNDSFDRALASRPPRPPGVGFRAFVIERDCASVLELPGTSLPVKAEEDSIDSRSLFREAESVFGSGEAAETWMSTPNPFLDRRVPREILGTPEGEAAVRRLLGLIDHGDYP